jgi:hypothetical protein
LVASVKPLKSQENVAPASEPSPCCCETCDCTVVIMGPFFHAQTQVKSNGKCALIAGGDHSVGWELRVATASG